MITEVNNNEDYKKVLGQILHHIGVEIEQGTIDIHNSTRKQGVALNLIGQVLKGYDEPENAKIMLESISKQFNLTNPHIHILELAQEILCEDWESRIEKLNDKAYFILDNEDETIKLAVNGDGAALARVGTYLQKWVKSIERNSGRESAENHAKIEARRLSIKALAYASNEKVKDFDLIQEEIIKQA